MSESMFKKLDEVEKKFERLNQELQEPGIVDNQQKYRGLMKEFSDLEKVVSTYREYKRVVSEIESNKELLESENDPDMKELAKQELASLESQKPELEEQLKLLLLPKDPNDDKNIILEIRAGAGGDESSLFAAELFRSYSQFAENKGWKVEVLSASPGNSGGYREIIANISGKKVYSRLKFESGVHRVQRVPQTESQGRIHTSTVTVAVLPEAEAVDVQVNQNDLRIDVYRSSGHGGQSVNTTDSAVRITHFPTGIVVTCQEGKSQRKNRDQALKVLYSRLLAKEEEKARQEASDSRLAQIGSGDRSERIRTYNFPQSRVTDHRINLTSHALDDIMNGGFDTLIDPLITHYQSEALKEQTRE